MTAAVGVVGASGRAAAMSAVRAGLVPWVVDLFADRDTRRVATAVSQGSLADYPHGLAALAAGMPPGPVLYTGGLENAPEVVAALAATRPLWGNGPEILARVRDPFAVAAVLAAADCPTSRTLPAGAFVPPGRWLHKSLNSSGGMGVRIADRDDRPPPGVYLQEFVDGPPMSAQFVSHGAGTRLLGVTEQLVGEPWLHAATFGYAGNIGPSPLSNALGPTLERLGAVLAGAFALRGLWGVDFLLRDGEPLVVEVNPRYTSAVEVIEFATGLAALCQHRLAFEPGCRQHDGPPDRPPAVGKAVYFAPHTLAFPSAGFPTAGGRRGAPPWNSDLFGPFDRWRLPGFADIPAAGEVFQPGDPVLTVFATGATTEGCRATLMDRAAELDRLFAGCVP